MRLKERLIGLAALLSALSGCDALEPVIAHATLPERNDCFAKGVSVVVAYPEGKVSVAGGCVETRPYPGQPMPGGR